jgi:UDP-glucose:(heptosyl)LPS alpha-1,3-glucosyltransferase
MVWQEMGRESAATGSIAMRVALSIEHFEPSRGGGETFARNFARMLRQEGHEVHVFTLSWDAAEEGFIYHQIPKPSQLRRFAFARRARKMLAAERFDLIHGFGKSIYMDILRPGGGVHRAWQDHEVRSSKGKAAKLKRRIKQWGSLDQQLVLRLEKLQFGPGRKHLIIAVSRLVRDEIIRHYGCEPERIRVIHNGANLAAFTPQMRQHHRAPVRSELGLKPDEIALLFVGHNFQRKGLQALIRALPLLRRTGRSFRLVVVGQGERDPCDRLASLLGVSRLIH